jgi:hypothetical protein
MLKQVVDTRGKREFTGVRGGANRLDYPSVIQNGHGIAREIGLSSELRNRPRSSINGERTGTRHILIYYARIERNHYQAP